MTRIVIDTFETFVSDGPFLAVVGEEGTPLAKTRLAVGSTQRAATLSALRAFYDDSATVTPAEEARVAEVRAQPGRYASLKTLIERAITDNNHVQITYVDSRDNETVREIIPVKMEERPAQPMGLPEWFITALDVEKDDSRTFRLDRIKDAQLVMGMPS